jgi:hypothetical protein
MSGWQIAGFLLCVALATGAQRLTGFALALVLLGLTSLLHIAPLPDVANVATVLSLANAAIVLRGARHSMDWGMLRPTVAGSVFGVGAGLLLLGWLNTNVVVVLRLLLGLIIVACAIIVVVRTEPLPQRSCNASFGFYGVLSGLLGGLFASAGPPLVYQFYRQPIDLETLRDTLIAALATSSLLRLAVVLPSGQFSAHALMLSALALPLTTGITWWVQKHPPRWPRQTVLKLVCTLLLVTGTGLVVPALQALGGQLLG